MERLGESPAFGFELLDLLGRGGWVVAVLPAFAGDGVMVIASRNGYEVRRSGATVAEIAPKVFAEATRVQRLALDEDVQLSLVSRP